MSIDYIYIKTKTTDQEKTTWNRMYIILKQLKIICCCW